MNKIISAIIISTNLLTITANAAWEFDEKVIMERAPEVMVSNDIITTYSFGYIGMTMDPYMKDMRYYDLKGNHIEDISSYNDSKSSNTVKLKDEAKDEIEYFTLNNQSIIQKTENGIFLEDLNGNVLASNFELSHQWERNDVARKVKKDERYGIMAYDGRMIIPMENDGAAIYDNGIYTAENDGVTSVYNFAGERLFTLDNNIVICSVGSADWMSVELKKGYSYNQALINYKGEYLTDFCYDHIKIYENNQEWQSGSFAKLRIGRESKYIDRNFNEIDINSTDNVYGMSCIDFEDFAIINNSITEGLKTEEKTAIYDKEERKYLTSFIDGQIITNGEQLIYTDGQNSYMIDKYGNGIGEQLSGKAHKLYEYSEGLALFIANNGGKRCYIDAQGNNIFNKLYEYGKMEQIDNNEFVVVDNYTVKILTAKGIIGEALNTDVKIDINGYQIPCYSAYGYAVIKAEDLRYFGFDVEWNGEERMLYISRNPEYYDITAGDFGESGETGTHYDDIYGSDINVEYNGKRLSSYCIDGETLIKPEDLAAEGITFNYDDSQRTLFMNVEGLEKR